MRSMSPPTRRPWRRGVPELRAAIDFVNCDTIQVVLSTAEVFPASASMKLETAGGMLDLGTQIFGLTRAPEQTIEFALPALSRRLRVSAIRVVFHRNPAQQDQSTRVAIQGSHWCPGFSRPGCSGDF